MTVERLAAFSADELYRRRDDCPPHGISRPRRRPMLAWPTAAQARAEAICLSAATVREAGGCFWSIPLERLDEWAETHGADAPAYA